MSDKPGTGAVPSPLETLTSECEGIRAYCAQLRKHYQQKCQSQMMMRRIWLIAFPSFIAALAWSSLLLPVQNIGNNGWDWSLSNVLSEASGWRHTLRSLAPVLAPICAIIAAISVLAKVDQPPAPYRNLPAALNAVSQQCEYILQLGKLSPPELLMPEIKDLQSRLLGMMRLFQPSLTSLPQLKGK